MVEDLQKQNSRLSDTIVKIEDRNRTLQQKLEQYKLQAKILRSAISLQCKYCNSFQPAEVFAEHAKSCNQDNKCSRSHFFQIPLSISIQSTQIVEEEDKSYTEYVILVTFNGQCWTANQKYKTFCALHESLINQYPSVTFPQTSYQFAKISSSSSQQRSVDRCKTLQAYL